MTPLRQRLIDDLRVRNYSPRTVEAYVAAVAKLARHFRTSPDRLSPEQIRQFQVHLVGLRVSFSQLNQVTAGLRFFYGITLGRPDVVHKIAYGKRPKKLPVVLAPEEVTRLFDAAPDDRDRMLLRTGYALGLRVSELVALRRSTSTPPAAWSPSATARGPRTASCPCRPACSASCAATGGCGGRDPGCSPAAAAAATSAPRACSASCAGRRSGPA